MRQRIPNAWGAGGQMIFPNGRNRSLTRLKRFLARAMSSWSPGAQMFNPMGSNRFRAATIRDVCMEYRSPLRFIFFLSWSETAAYGTKINIGICNNFLSQDSWAFSNWLFHLTDELTVHLPHFLLVPVFENPKNTSSLSFQHLLLILSPTSQISKSL